MANFNKQEWKKEKLVEFNAKLINELKNIRDSELLINEVRDSYTSTLDEIIFNSDIISLAQAEDMLKNKSKKIGSYFNDGLMIFIDTYSNVIKLEKAPIDISGSSIDDGNNKLYPDNVFEFRQVNDKYHSNLRNKVI